MKQTLHAVQYKEVEYPLDMNVDLADLIKRCLVRDFKKRMNIKMILDHPLFMSRADKKMMLHTSLGSRLGVLGSQKKKRPISQSNERSLVSVTTVPTSIR